MEDLSSPRGHSDALWFPCIIIEDIIFLIFSSFGYSEVRICIISKFESDSNRSAYIGSNLNLIFSLFAFFVFSLDPR